MSSSIIERETYIHIITNIYIYYNIHFRTQVLVIGNLGVWGPPCRGGVIGISVVLKLILFVSDELCLCKSKLLLDLPESQVGMLATFRLCIAGAVVDHNA